MTRYHKKALPTKEWLEELIDRKLEEFVTALEGGEKITPADFDRLVQFHREKFKPKIEYAKIEWVDDWDDEDWWKRDAA